jgi:integrase
MGVDAGRGLASGTVELRRVGAVVEGADGAEPFVLVDPYRRPVDAVGRWLRDLVVSDYSVRTVRAYCFAMLTWFRVLWQVGVAWDRATESETVALVGWMRTARNPQRSRKVGSPSAGSVNVKTGKPLPAEGYQPASVNVTLAAVHGFYAFHARFGEGPVANPVPASPDRRRALAHRSPIAPPPRFRRARYRQKGLSEVPRSIPDEQWAELFAAARCDRDRALLSGFRDSGARASEMLALPVEDVDWAGQRIWVVSKGSRVRRVLPLSPASMVWLGRYLDAAGPPPLGTPIWRVRRGAQRPLTYMALRRVVQRINDELGTNWSLHDFRHTAAARMVSSGVLTLPEVQVVLGHADLRTTSRYTLPRVEELCARMQEFYASPPAPARRYAPGYDPADIAAVFGG